MLTIILYWFSEMDQDETDNRSDPEVLENVKIVWVEQSTINVGIY
jgi:hypothetical protein